MARNAVMADSFPPGSLKGCWLFVCHLVGYKRSGARLLILMFFTRVCFTTRSGPGPGVSVRPLYDHCIKIAEAHQLLYKWPHTDRKQSRAENTTFRRPLHSQQQLPSGLHRGFGLTLNDSLANHLTWTDASITAPALPIVTPGLAPGSLDVANAAACPETSGAAGMGHLGGAQ